MKKLIACECPLDIIKEVRRITDYDYCLVHLLDENLEYLQFFEESLKFGRRVILDNSIFELGTAFDSDRFANWVKKLRPTEYIIPDVLEDSEETVRSLHSWISKYRNIQGVKIGVVQGKNYTDLVSCYQKIEPYVDKVAISFNYSYYEELFPHPNKIISWSMGRLLLISRMLESKVINIKKPHHLLGCSSRYEFYYYSHEMYSFIETIDTSNPVVFGLLGMEYSDSNIFEKPEQKLITFFNNSIDSKQKSIIFDNIKQLRSLIDKKIYTYHFIYKTTNLITNQIYVGQRFNCKYLNDGYIGCGVTCQKEATENIYFHNAIQEYGYENFKREIIEFLDNPEDLDLREIFWIKELNSHWTFGNYNMTWGGYSNNKNHPNKQEIYKKISNSLKGNIPWNKGKRGVYSEETLIKMRSRVISKETREKLSNLLKNRKWSDEQRKKRRETFNRRPVRTCPYCGVQGRGSGIVRFHFNNCKLK